MMQTGCYKMERSLAYFVNRSAGDR